jgi:hypothetical protein
MHGTKSFLNRLLRQSGYEDVPTKVPALQSNDRTLNLQGQSDLRERPVLAADADDRVPRTDDREVACLARARREVVQEVGVGPPSVLVGQDGDGDAPSSVAPRAAASITLERPPQTTMSPLEATSCPTSRAFLYSSPVAPPDPTTAT